MDVGKIPADIDKLVDPDVIELDKTLRGVKLVSTERLGENRELITGKDEETIGSKVVATELFWLDVEGGPKGSEGTELDKGEIEEVDKLATEDDDLIGTVTVVACVLVNELTTTGLDLDLLTVNGALSVDLTATELDIDWLTVKVAVGAVTLVVTGTDVDWPTGEETTGAVVALELGATT